MKLIKTILVTLTVIFGIASCDSPPVDSVPGEDFFDNAENVQVETVKQGSYISTEVEHQSRVIDNEGAFETFWNDIHKNQNPIPDTPDVDFSTERVIVSIMGSRPSGGYVTEIVKAGILNSELGVKVEMRSPGEGCVTTAAITNPYHIVTVENTGTPVQFFQEEITIHCND